MQYSSNQACLRLRCSCSRAMLSASVTWPPSSSSLYLWLLAAAQVQGACSPQSMQLHPLSNPLASCATRLELCLQPTALEACATEKFKKCSHSAAVQPCTRQWHVHLKLQAQLHYLSSLICPRAGLSCNANQRQQQRYCCTKSHKVPGGLSLIRHAEFRAF